MKSIIILALLCSLAYSTWVHFLAVMMLKQRRDSLPMVTKRFGYIVLGIGYALDFLFNVSSSLLFLEIPQEWLFTARVSRHVKEVGWRGNLARWFCGVLLEPVDPGHCG